MDPTADDLLGQPITTLERARALYVAMGCNGYHIWRESPDRHEEFQQLVPRSLQLEWRLVEFELTRDALLSDRATDRRFAFGYLIDLSDWSRAAIEDILAVSQQMEVALSPTDAILAAEDLLARNALEARTGAALRAHDQGYRDLAMQLLEVVSRLLAVAAPDGKHITLERIASAKDRMSATAKLMSSATSSLAQRIRRWFGRWAKP